MLLSIFPIKGTVPQKKKTINNIILINRNNYMCWKVLFSDFVAKRSHIETKLDAKDEV